MYLQLKKKKIKLYFPMEHCCQRAVFLLCGPTPGRCLWETTPPRRYCAYIDLTFSVRQGNLHDLWSSTGKAACLGSRSCRRRHKTGCKALNASEIHGNSCLIFLWQCKGETKTEQIFRALKCYSFHLKIKCHYF